MGKKLTPEQQIFYKRIDTILWEQWDPIGLNDDTEAPSDEYDSYVGMLFSLAIRGSTKEELSELLIKIEKEYMGLDGNHDNCTKIASLILREKAELSL